MGHCGGRLFSVRLRKGLRKEMTLINQSWESRVGRRVGRGFPDTGFPRAEAGGAKDGGMFGRLQALWMGRTWRDKAGEANRGRVGKALNAKLRGTRGVPASGLSFLPSGT